MNKKLVFILLLLGIGSFFIDSYVLEFFKLIENSNLTLLFKVITFFGKLWVVSIIALLLFLRKKDAILSAYLSLVITFFLVYVLKFIVNRERPADSLVIEGLSSFPSGHAAVTLAIWPILRRVYPKWRWWAFSFLILILISRLYLRVHFLSDVIFGAILGYIIGEGVLYARKDRI